MTGCGAGLRSRHSAGEPESREHDAPRPRAATSAGGGPRRRRARRSPICEPPSAIHLSSLPRSAAFCQRSSGSFARHRRTTRSSAGGVIGATAEMGAGSSFMIDEISDACVAPENAFLPVAISYSTHPNEKMSVRPSASRPSSCSGAMYWNVPRIVPSCVRLFGMLPSAVGSDVTADWHRRRHRLGQPEVEQLHARLRDHHVARLQVPVHDPLPVRLVQRVRDLRPEPQRLLERQRALGEAIATASRPRAAPSPGTRPRPRCPTSYSAQMFECDSCEIVFASRSNRCRISGDADRCCGSTFTATVRSSRVSFAL